MNKEVKTKSVASRRYDKIAVFLAPTFAVIWFFHPPHALTFWFFLKFIGAVVLFRFLFDFLKLAIFSTLARKQPSPFDKR